MKTFLSEATGFFRQMTPRGLIFPFFVLLKEMVLVKIYIHIFLYIYVYMNIKNYRNKAKCKISICAGEVIKMR